MKKQIYLIWRKQAVIMVIFFLLAGGLGITYVSKIIGDKPKYKYSVVIDPGHGGDDPGKVSASGVLEKDINLSIALKLQRVLEEQNIKVVMTRTEDKGLYSENAPNKKREDLLNRILKVKETKPNIVVSIHQNSFTQPQYQGAQTFYYTNSQEGKLLAEQIRKAIIEMIDPDNDREVKGNSDYYLLKKSQYTTVIVECGFLSNAEETKKLIDEAYQDKMAEAIAKGILTYWENIENAPIN